MARPQSQAYQRSGSPADDNTRYTEAEMQATTSASSIMKVKRRYPSRGKRAWEAKIACFSWGSSQWARGISALCSLTLP